MGASGYPDEGTRMDKQVKVQRRIMVSKLAPARLQAARNMTVLGGLICFGLLGTIILFIWGDKSSLVVLLATAFMATLACTGCLGMYVYGRVMASIIVAEDTVHVSEMPDPSEGKKEPLVASKKSGVSGRHLVVGPVRFTVAQWRLIYQASMKEHWRFSRKLIEASGANVSNLPTRYTQLSKWMLENSLIVDLEPQKRHPKYELTQAGKEAMQYFIAGKVPGRFGGGSR
jgi:hypothetical protein